MFSVVEFQVYQLMHDDLPAEGGRLMEQIFCQRQAATGRDAGEIRTDRV